MLVDARDLPQGGRASADLCVIGSGAAGIAIALQFADTPVRVIVLESGGLTAEPGGQGIHEVVARPTPRLAVDPSRMRYFGGNTNHWAGNCGPLDEADFEPRDWIPHSGWPIRKSHLLPYYERAQEVCGLSDFSWYDLEACRPHLSHPPLDVDPAKLVSKVLHTCPVTSFADRHRRRLETTDSVRVWLHAHAVSLKTNARGDQVLAVETSGADGRGSRIEADTFVLAGGGVENARLLLASNDVSRDGLGNDRDLVGRFFMDHWYVDIPLGRWGETLDLALYEGRQPVRGASVWCQLVLSEALMRSERMAGLSLWFQRTRPDALSVEAARRLMASLHGWASAEEPFTDLRLALSDPGGVARHVLQKLSGRGDLGPPPEGYALRVQLEQKPDPQNRIRLSSESDRFGQARPELALRLGADERRRHARCLQIVGAELGLNGPRLARQLELLLGGGRLGFFWHHMGATRMHSDPEHGVVDSDCRVHGVSNLFVAGSSVFPTGGTASPTLTIVALALRLAAHLRDRLGMSRSL
jgi:choline dehydrogenase-like flavoprotein